MTNSEWQPIETAPEGAEVMTKIHDAGGVRNVQAMVKRGNLWMISADKPNAMYVYYRPTHWMPLPSPPKETMP